MHVCSKSLPSCATLCDPMQPALLLCPWDSPGMGFHAALQGIFPTQGSNPLLSPALAVGIFTRSATWEAQTLKWSASKKNKKKRKRGRPLLLLLLPSFLSSYYHYCSVNLTGSQLPRKPGRCSWDQLSTTLNSVGRGMAKSESERNRQRTSSYTRQINLLQQHLLILQS